MDLDMKQTNGQTIGRWKSPQAISGVISKTMKSLGLARPYDGWQVVTHWAEIVGDEIAERARAVRYENGTLHVAVPDDVWRHQLSLQIESILKKVHAQPYGRAVQRIRLQRGPKEKMDP